MHVHTEIKSGIPQDHNCIYITALRPRSGAQTLTDEYGYNQAIAEGSVLQIQILS